MGFDTTQARRRAAALVLVVHVVGLVVAPVLHLVDHQPDHAHGPALARLDWERLTDSRTGRVDLQRLAQELGLQDEAHRTAHAEGRPHHHGSTDEHPADHPHHGSGAIEHFAAALLTTPVVLEPVWRPAPAHPAPPAGDTREQPPTHPFLSAQQAQGPPA